VTTRERILDIARRRFGASGYADTSMQQIADELGVTKAALYYHFRSKSELLLELTQPVLDAFDTALETSAGRPDSEGVPAAAAAYLDVALEHREIVRQLARDLSFLGEHEVIAERFRSIIRRTNELVARGATDLRSRVIAAQVVAGLGDVVAIFADAPVHEVRRHALDGARATLGVLRER
jgi:AcrR family transcriptional regulator